MAVAVGNLVHAAQMVVAPVAIVIAVAVIIMAIAS
jgi:hypothetical protein